MEWVPAWTRRLTHVRWMPQPARVTVEMTMEEVRQIRRLHLGMPVFLHWILYKSRHQQCSVSTYFFSDWCLQDIYVICLPFYANPTFGNTFRDFVQITWRHDYDVRIWTSQKRWHIKDVTKMTAHRNSVCRHYYSLNNHLSFHWMWTFLRQSLFWQGLLLEIWKNLTLILTCNYPHLGSFTINSKCLRYFNLISQVQNFFPSIAAISHITHSQI